MSRQGRALVGRYAERVALWPRPGRGELVLLRGARGSGRSAVLTRLRADLAAEGVTVLHVHGAAADPFGVGALLAAVRARFEELGADPALAASVNVVDRLGRSGSSVAGRAALVAELGRMYSRIGGGSRAVLLVDDVDLVPDPMFVLAQARRAGHSVVAAVAGDRPGSAQLDVLADRVVTLAPLPDADVAQLLRQTLRRPLDPEALDALRAALGPLFGNPGTVLGTVADLRARRRLVAVHDHLCLHPADEPVALAADHRLLAGFRAATDVARDIGVLVAADPEFGVDDVPVLARATGRPPELCGRVLDELVLAGALETVEDGRLRFGAPALGCAVLAAVGGEAVRELHRAMATALLGGPVAQEPGPSGLGPAEQAAADHVAAAGAALPPSPRLALRLQDEAVGVAATDPERAARRHHAAWRHAAPGRERDRIRGRLVRLLVRGGLHDRLAEFVEEAVTGHRPDRDPAAWDSGERDELAHAAALAALHRGRAVPGPVATALAATSGAPDPLRFCARWFAGRPQTLDDLVAAFAGFTERGVTRQATPLRQERVKRRRASSGVEAAFAGRDLVPVFGWLLGPDYGTPVGGLQHAVHRVVAGYADGRWTDALSAARALVPGATDDPLTRQQTVLLAAEISAQRGKDRRAAAWLDLLPADGTSVALRGWVEAGTVRGAGDPATMLARGWRSYCADVGADVGAGPADTGGWRLLIRLTGIAVTHGLPHWVDALHRAAHARRTGDDSAVARESMLLIGGMATAGAAATRAGVELVRRRAHRPDLGWSLLAAGLTVPGAVRDGAVPEGAVPDDPDPWLQEAHQVAQDLGSLRLRTAAREAMHARGIAVRAAPSRAERFSSVELRIIELIRQGSTNRQIATRIRMSEKTVENYLTKLFVKIGCQNRQGLAAASFDGRLDAVGA